MSVTAPLDLMASLVLESEQRWGEVATPEQYADAEAIIDPARPTPYHFLTRARGYSKTTDLGGIAVAVMLEQLPPASRLYGLAADRDQGRLLVDSIAGLASRTPGLANALKVDTYRVMATRTGSVLDIIAADAPSAFGLRPAFLVVDDLPWWADTTQARQLFDATSTALTKVPGARMAVIGNAGDPAHWSYKILKHARRDPLWRVHEIPGPPPWADPARLAEQRRRVLDSTYRRLFLNEWTSAEDRLTTADDLKACVTLDGPLPFSRGLAGRYAIAVDLGLKNDRSVVAVCHTEPLEPVPPVDPRAMLGLPESVDLSTARIFLRHLQAQGHAPVPSAPPQIRRRIVLDRIEVWQGSRANPLRLQIVEDFIAQASDAYGRPPVIFDPWQSAGMQQRLQARGVRVVEFSFSSTSVGRLGLTLHQLIRSHLLALPDDAELIDELANVRLRETSPGVVRMDHDAGRHDDRAIAIALAAQHLLKQVHGGAVTRAASHRGSLGRDPVKSWDQFATEAAGRRLDEDGCLIPTDSPRRRDSIMDMPL